MDATKSAFTRRALLSAGVSGAAALALSACGASGSVSSSGRADKKISLMLLGPTKQTLDWFNTTVLPEFKEKEGIDVEVRQSDWGSGFQKLLTATASGTLADVTMLGQVMTPALSSKHAFLPIDDYLDQWAQTDKFYPAMLEDGMYDGKSYAVPVYADVRTSVYRADLLSKVGVSADSLPTDWDDFKALARKLSTANGGPLATPYFAGQDTAIGLMQTYSQLLYQAGGSFFDKNGKSQLSGPEGLKALEYLVSFFEEGLADAHVVYQGTGPRPLVQGTAAMTLNSRNVAQNALENDPSVEEQIVAGTPLSASKGGKPVTIAWINKLAISAKTKNPDAAWALLSHLASNDVAAKYSELYGGLPARTDLSEAPYLSDVNSGFVDATQYAKSLPTTPNLLEIQQDMNVALQSAIRQSSSPQRILSDLDKKIDAINGK